MEKDLISIIIPVYKVEKFLEKCVNSVLEQTYKNLEIILVDDGSPDNCPALCDSLAKKDKRIKVIHKKNGGVSSARNAALDEAKGKYVCFVDSDDYVEPTYAEDLHKAITENDVQMAVCELFDVYEDKKEIGFSFDKDFVFDVSDTEAFNNNIEKLSSPTNKMYDAKVLKNHRFRTNLKYGEDQTFNFEYFEMIKSIACIHKPLYNYVANAGSFIKSHLKDVTIYHDILFEYQKKFAENTNNPKLLAKLAAHYCFDFIVSLYFIKVDHGKKESKKYFKHCFESGELKFFEEAISLMDNSSKKYKFAQKFLKKKSFSLCYLLSMAIYLKRKFKGQLNFS